MTQAHVNSYTYVTFDGGTGSAGSSERLLKNFDNLTTAALGFANSRDHKLVYLKDEEIPQAHELLKLRIKFDPDKMFTLMKEMSSMPVPARIDAIKREREALEEDEHFFGFSLLSQKPSITAIEKFDRFCGIHQSGLLFYGTQKNSPIPLSEHLFKQFKFFVVEHKGRPIRMYNDQSSEVRDYMGGLKALTLNPTRATEILEKIETDFLKRYPQFSSKYDFLERTELSETVQREITETTEFGTIHLWPETMDLALS